MSLGKFIKSRYFFLTLLGFVVSTVVIVWITMLSVSRYTNHGEAFPTPNIIDLEKQNYRSVLNQHNLRYEIRDSLFEKGHVPGSVIEQYPLPGHYVKGGRMIFLTIAAEKPEQVILPNLKDISLRQAKVIMAKNGLILGDLIFKPSQYNDLVLDQKIGGESIKQGTSVDRGTLVDLVVGKRNMSATTQVPELIGLSIIEVEERLNQANLNLGSVIYDGVFETLVDSAQAIVAKQSPESSVRKAREGSAVDIWLSIPNDSIQGDDILEELDDIDNF